jgi:hypothetical protein
MKGFLNPQRMRNTKISIEETKEILLQLSKYVHEENLTARSLADRLNIPYNTTQKWSIFCQGTSARNPSEAHLGKIKEFLPLKHETETNDQIKEAKHRVQKITYLLLLLEDQLDWFRNSDEKIRDEFRKALNVSDIGYISSLLTMLTEENKFQRWLTLSSNRFQYLRKGKVNGQETDQRKLW